MFRTYQVLWNRLSQLIDAVNVVLSFLIAWYVKFGSGWLPYGGHYSLSYYLPTMLAAVPIFLLSNWISGLYKPLRSRSFWRVSSTIVQSLVIGTVLFMSFLYFIHVSQFSRAVLVTFTLSLLVLNYLKHLVVLRVLRMMRSRGYNKKFVIIIGWTAAATRFLENLEHHPWFGYQVVGYISATVEDSGIEYLGDYAQLRDILHQNVVDYALICLPRSDISRMPDIVGVCESLGTQSLIVPDYFDLLPAKPRFETFAGMPLIDTRYVPLDDALNAALKRGFDIVFSAIVLVALSPIFLTLSVLIKFSSKGPILFVQERVGKNRRIFRMYKFRTMINSGSLAETEDDGWTVPNDPRRTSIGKFMRRFSLDELPQFWNVLIGDMSVIGPRPERAVFVEQFKQEVPKYMVKHRVRPGITGWAQVNGWRGDTSIPERIRYDIEYIEGWSLGLDLKIVAKTILHGFNQKNAY